MNLTRQRLIEYLHRATILVVLALFCIACANPIRKLERETILQRMASLHSFTGTYGEIGVAQSEQQTRIAAQTTPWIVKAETISAGAAKGSVLYYAAGTLAMYFPQSHFGIRYRNVPELTAAQQAEWLEAEYDWHIAHYDIRRIPDGKVAGYETKGILYTPNAAFAASPFSFTWEVDVEPNFAFALKTMMKKNDAVKYQIEFKQIDFQKPLAADEKSFRFPAGSTTAEYDLASRNFTAAAARGTANFALAVPKDTPNFALKKIIRVQGFIPAFTLYYENLPYQTYYTQVRDYGLNIAPQRGLVLQGKRSYRVNFSGAYRSVYFLEKGVYHTIVSSRPLSELLEWLETI